MKDLVLYIRCLICSRKILTYYIITEIYEEAYDIMAIYAPAEIPYPFLRSFFLQLELGLPATLTRLMQYRFPLLSGRSCPR